MLIIDDGFARSTDRAALVGHYIVKSWVSPLFPQAIHYKISDWEWSTLALAPCFNTTKHSTHYRSTHTLCTTDYFEPGLLRISPAEPQLLAVAQLRGGHASLLTCWLAQLGQLSTSCRTQIANVGSKWGVWPGCGRTAKLPVTISFYK